MKNILVAVSIFFVGVLGYFAYANTFTKSTEITNIRVTGAVVLAPGDTISVEYNNIRHRSCTLDIKRYIENEDQREFLIHEVVQNVVGDGGTRPSGYTAEIPTVPAGKYKVFARVRYYCNILDYVFPRYLETEKLPITIVARH